MLKKDAFLWTPAAQLAFKALQDALTSTPTLQLPNFSAPFTLDTDASNVGIGAVLSQLGHPLAYFSQKLSPRQQSLSTYAKEMLAIVAAVQKWRHYLLGCEFIIRTDHKSLQHLHEKTIQTPEQSEWLRKLLGFKYRILYKPGRDNVAADALSRCHLAFSSPHYHLTDDIRQAQLADPLLQKLIQTLRTSPLALPSHSLHNDLLLYRGRLLLPAGSPLCRRIFLELHSSPLGGHSGYRASLSRIKRSFAWKHMQLDVKRWVSSCNTCQHCKYSPHKPPGLLQPLPIPSQVWEDISLDFITSLPSSHGKTAILVVADRLSKYAHFFGLSPHYTATSVADVFLSGVFKLHGTPRSIVSDRDPLFLSQFWTELFTKLGSKLRFSSAYHPQSDGQTEVINRCLQQYLRCFVSDHPQHWFRFLPLAEFWYNTSFHSSLQLSPFEALYHRPPPPLLHHPKTGSPSAADSLLQHHSEILQRLRSRLHSAQQRMCNQANKSRADIEFQVGDFVLVRLQQYRQLSVSRTKHKFTPKYFGPFEITAKISPVAYTLRLPPSSRIHNTFHISLLRPFVGDPSLAAPASLPSEFQLPSPTDTDVLPFLQEKKAFERVGVDTNQQDDARPNRQRKKPCYLDDYYMLLD